MAHAQEQAQNAATDAAAEAADLINAAPDPASAFAWNMGLIVLLVVMFYFLMIRPQQKRFQAHKEMLDGLKKGDEIVTSGGLVGTIDTIKDGDDKIVIDLGEVKVTALRSTLQGKTDDKAAEKKEDKKDNKK